MNDLDEFICFEGDTIFFRIYNHDAFGSYSIGEGTINIRSNNRNMYLDFNNISHKTSVVSEVEGAESILKIVLLNSDNSPMSFTTFKIEKIGNLDSDISYISDSAGVVHIRSDIIDTLEGEPTSFKVVSLGFITEKTIPFHRGNIYIIKSIIPIKFPFTVKKTNELIINENDSKSIDIKLNQGRFVTLREKKVDCNCEELFYRK